MDVFDNDFEQRVLEKSKEVSIVVDFWATWCAPCVLFKPVLEKLEKEFGGKFILAKLNVDENLLTAKRFSINAIPAVKLFKGGQVVAEFEGMLPEESLKKWLDKYL